MTPGRYTVSVINIFAVFTHFLQTATMKLIACYKNIFRVTGVAYRVFNYMLFCRLDCTYVDQCIYENIISRYVVTFMGLPARKLLHTPATKVMGINL